MNRLYGLIGQKLGHSFSKRIHSFIFNELGMDACYHLFEIEPENLKNTVSSMINLGVNGVNVTIPYKCEIIKYLDNLSPEASKIGAVNTIGFADGAAKGYNTDYFGFKMMLEKYDIDIKNKKIVILGSGGVADSVLQYLVDNEPEEIVIVGRDVSKVQLKYRDKHVIITNYNGISRLKCRDIIINCTPCGMFPNIDITPVDINVLKNYNTAIDLIYNPTKTLFLKQASDCGAKTVNGYYMLIAQAVKAEEIWNDIYIDRKIIDRIYKYFSDNT